MKTLDFPIIKLTLCLVLGTSASFLFSISLPLSIYISVGLLALLFASFIRSKFQYRKSIQFGLITYLTMFSIGILVVNLHNPLNSKKHYTNQISINDEDRLIAFTISEVLKPTAYQDKYVVNLNEVDGKKVSGKLLLNVQKDSLQPWLKVDDVLMCSGILNELNKPLNPHQFDYSKYLKNHDIFHQINVEQNSMLKISSGPFTVKGYAAEFRLKVRKRLQHHDFEKEELAIIDALLMGQRKDISQETYNSYVNAGTIHILAISGLHIGILAFALQWLFNPLGGLKYGNWLKGAVIISILWGFAVISGMSPSVLRAVAMFTAVVLALNLKRANNIYNTLAISMLFLLLCRPSFLLEVGFQMSYIAVISIVAIQSLLKKLWYPKYKVTQYFWNIFTVTIAAQVGVAPISLYYFHQFPGLFFISNLIVIPLLTLILILGIISIMLAIVNVLPQWLADFFGFLISQMNSFVSWISRQESFIFRDIAFGILIVIASYIIIISIVSYLKSPRFSRMIVTLIALLIFQLTCVYIKHKNQTNELAIFHKSKATIIGQKENDILLIASNFESLSIKKEHIIRNYKVGESIKTIDTLPLQNVFAIGSEKLLVIDSLGIYQISFKPEYILLRNSPKINLDRLIDSLKPKQIIADGSNYRSYVARWQETCLKRKTPFHATFEKGAYIIDY